MTRHMTLLRVAVYLATATPVAALTIVSFNIHAWRDATHLSSFDRLVRLLRSLQPDVLCLNEVLEPFTAPPEDDPYWEVVRRREGYGCQLPAAASPSEPGEAFLARLSSELELPHVAFGAATLTRSFFGVVPFGNAILSKHRMSRVRRVVATSTGADLQLGGQPRTSQDLEDRGLLMACIELPGGAPTLGIACTHLDHKAEELREKQTRHFVHEVRTAFDATQPVLLCGDLNSFDERDMDGEEWLAICALYASKGWPPPRSRSLVRDALEAGGFEDTFERHAASLSPGNDVVQARPPPTSWTQTRIDYVLAHDSDTHVLRVTGHRTVQSDASDHLPVVVQLELVER